MSIEKPESGADFAAIALQEALENGGPFYSDDEEEVENRPTPAFWSVAVYLVDRAYGGPEEGGWWYDYGIPIEEKLDGVGDAWLPHTFKTEQEADDYADEVQVLLDANVNRGRREISSVLSEGVYRAIVTGGFPKPFPAERPHYE